MDAASNEKAKLAEEIKRLLVKEKRYRDPDFSAKQLAEMMGISTFKLSRIIRTELGMAYADLVHTHRIQEATKLLADKRYTPYMVDDIGKMVGFNNRQSFFAAFKRLTGTTPERYRRM